MREKFLFLFADLLQASIQAVVVIMIAYRYGAAGVASYGFAVSLSMPITTFFSASLRKIAATNQGAAFGVGEIFFLRHVLTVMTVIASLWAAFLYVGAVEKSYLQLFMVIALYKTVERYYELLQGLYQKESRKKELALANINKSLGFLLSFVIASYFFESLVIVFLLCTVVVGVFTLAAWKSLCEMVGLNPHLVMGEIKEKVGLKKLIAVGLPLAFLALFVSLNVHLPRLIIESRFDEDVFAYFILQMNFFSMFSVVVISLSQYSLSSLNESYRSRDMKLYVAMSLRIITAAIAVFAVYWVFMVYLSHHVVSLFYADVGFRLFEEVLSGVLSISLPLFLVTALSFIVFPFYKHALSLVVNIMVVCVLWTSLGKQELTEWFSVYSYIIWGQVFLTAIIFGFVAWREQAGYKKKGR